MRGYLASSIGLTCAAVLTLPCVSPATAAGTSVRLSPAAPAVPGSTQSLPLVPFTRAVGAVPAAGLTPQNVRPFSLIGVVWDDPNTPLDGRVEVRTRATGTHRWSEWQELEAHDYGHGPDPDTAEAGSSHVHGSTAPLWVGDSDGVEVRVRVEEDKTGTRAPVLPDGLRVELVDPGTESDAGVPGAEPHAVVSGAEPYAAVPGAEPYAAVPVGGPYAAVPAAEPHAAVPGAEPYAAVPDVGSHAGVPGAEPQAGVPGAEPHAGVPGAEPYAAVPGAEPHAGAPAPTAHAVSVQPSDGGASSATPGVDSAVSAGEDALAPPDAMAVPGVPGVPGLPGHAKTYAAPRPRIVTRSGWGADESLREAGFLYTDSVKVAFVHHTATGNNYTCSQAPSLIRSIYRYHVVSNGWRDIGYNFLVDKCGNIYEGRAGGADKPVMGAHTLGFNSDSMGVAVIGTFSSTGPSSDAQAAVAELTAWKLGLYGMDPRGRTYLESAGGNLYPKGVKARLNVISGHRDGYATDCPGQQLYGKLGTIRSTAARLQGR